MKRFYHYILIILALTCTLASCKKDQQVDVRDFGKVSLDSISPGKGPSDIFIEVYGKNFPYQKSEISVSLNGNPLEVTAISPNKITLYIPKGASSGNIHFSFNRTDPEHSNQNYSDIIDSTATTAYVIDESVIPPPVITAIDPKSGVIGAEVTITGFNFATVAGQAKLFFGATEAEITSVSRTKIVAKVPAGLTAPQTYATALSQGSYRVSLGNFNTLEPPPMLQAFFYIDGDGTIKKATFASDGTPTVIPFVTDAQIPLAVTLRKSTDPTLYYSNLIEGVNQIQEDGTKRPIYASPFNVITDLVVSESLMICIEYTGPDPSANYILSRNAAGIRPVKTLYTLPNSPSPVNLKASSTALNKIYWSEAVTHRVMEGSRSGSEAQEARVLFDSSDGLLQPAGIAIDETAGKIYIFDGYADKSAIYVGNMDGSGSLTKLPISADKFMSPTDLEIDPVKGVLYWLNFGSDQSLMSAKTDGSNVQPVMTGINFGSSFDILY